MSRSGAVLSALVLGAFLSVTGCGVPCYRQHVVAKGESLADVAERYNTSEAVLRKANRFDYADEPKPGERLFVPCAPSGRSSGTSELATAPPVDSPAPIPSGARAGSARPESKAERFQSPPASQAVDVAPAGTPPKAEEPSSAREKMAQMRKRKQAGADSGSLAAAPTGEARFRWPLAGQVVRGFSEGKDAAARGLDIKASPGRTVRAAGDGVVTYAGTLVPAYGPMVIVAHDGGFHTVYARLGSIEVAVGQRLAAGNPVGQSGQDNYIHFEVRQGETARDPLLYLPRR